MEIQTCVTRCSPEDSLEPERRIEQICGVGPNARERTVEVDCDALDLREAVGNEVAYILRRRNSSIHHRERKSSDAAVDQTHLADEPATDLERHRASSENRTALSVRSPAEVARVPHECGITKCQSEWIDDHRVVIDSRAGCDFLLVGHEHSLGAGVAVVPKHLERIRAVGRLANCLLEEEVRSSPRDILPPQRAIVLRKRLALARSRRRRVGDDNVSAVESGSVAGGADKLRSIAEVVLSALLDIEARRRLLRRYAERNDVGQLVTEDFSSAPGSVQ